MIKEIKEYLIKFHSSNFKILGVTKNRVSALEKKSFGKSLLTILNERFYGEGLHFHFAFIDCDTCDTKKLTIYYKENEENIANNN